MFCWRLPLFPPWLKLPPPPDPGVQGYLAHKKQFPPQDHYRALGIFLL